MSATGNRNIPVALAWTMGVTLCSAFVVGGGMAARILERTESISKGLDRVEGRLDKIEANFRDSDKAHQAKYSELERRVSLLEASREK